MLFKNIHFILVRPQLGENIGAAARSLKNFNFENLRLISPRDSWPNKSATYTAVEAKDIIHKAKVFLNTDQAVADLDCVFATTSRSRSVNKQIVDLSKAVKIIKKLSISNKKTGVFFGPEASGLSNDDLINANYLVNIPTSNKFKSLNLSHAVTIFAFELFISQKNFEPIVKNLYRSEDAKKNEVNAFLDFMISHLDKVGFLKPAEKKQQMIRSVKNIFHRSSLSTQEIRTLSGVISSLIKYKG
ncbi:MAG: TrmJ/YjtD family RNA methyltransferase [Proteobacteria bacterium]|jgi:tRNA/rRNA methyltransferase|nr:TrmJ/YjtD family RNA methyltransferase [Candidatus Fonsibacter ubiquis]NCU61931.1 TrmJ/YjtD family RNA methyltransferase [Candidatus Fonsibacter ubiquis]NCU69536.1 TrmJ/YjtD family RNA methyltransferase [Candidatus Fonsibacter ubiquis]NDG20456.1 TrmJ/YjtD family RNA methyltransferase [Pseudomonadota bacterium]